MRNDGAADTLDPLRSQVMVPRVLPGVLGVLMLAPAAAVAQRDSWRPPTAAEWKRPPLLEWQRNLDDALAVSRVTKKPLLICVNMDGESASENYAGVRYRDPEFAKLASGYVPIVASPNRHAPRDYDEKGNRIPCPRFGRVVCSEHIDIEPILYERYFAKNRVAPRHLGASIDGGILFDCFLNMDISPVLNALRANAASGVSVSRGASPDAWFGSRDAGDRTRLEDAYRAADVKGRRSLLRAAAAAKGVEPFDLLRLGLRDSDTETRGAAREALVATATVRAVPLLAEAVRQAKDAEERRVLSEVLLTLSRDDVRARRAVAVTRALDAKSAAVDVAAWKGALVKAKAPAETTPDPDQLERAVEERGAHLRAHPADGSAALALARANLDFAEERMAVQRNPTFLLDDAERALARAKENGVGGTAEWNLLAARLQFHRGDVAAAGPLALTGLRVLLSSPASREAALVLWIAAFSCRSRILAAQAEGKDWTSDVLTDGNAAFSVLAVHPLATPEQLAAHYDLLREVGAPEAAHDAVEAAVKRFPDSSPLHARYRLSVLDAGGIEALEAAYDRLRASTGNAAALEWFSGYADLVAAEARMRSGNDTAAREAYDRAIRRFEASAAKNATYAETAAYYEALALAGKARLSLDEGSLEQAVAETEAALERSPEVLQAEDGLGRTLLLTIGALRWALDGSKRADLRERLESAVESVDPELASRPAK